MNELDRRAGPERASEAFWRYNHNHWPAGTPGGQGGEFAPRGSGGDGPSPPDSTPRELTDLANLPQTAWDETADILPTGATAAANSPPPHFLPPKSKLGYFNTPEKLQTWHGVIKAAWEVTGHSVIQTYALATTFAMEGGMTPTDKGIIAGLKLVDLTAAATASRADDNALYPDLAGIGSTGYPAHFTPRQVAEISYFAMNQALHTVGGMKALDQIGDNQAAGALYDTLFWSGPAGGARLIQQAINGGAGPETVPVDGRMGPKTLEAYTRLVKTPSTRRKLLDGLAAARKLWAIANHQFDENRIEFFRFPDQG